MSCQTNAHLRNGHQRLSRFQTGHISVHDDSRDERPRTPSSAEIVAKVNKAIDEEPVCQKASGDRYAVCRSRRRMPSVWSLQKSPLSNSRNFKICKIQVISDWRLWNYAALQVCDIGGVLAVFISRNGIVAVDEGKRATSELHTTMCLRETLNQLERSRKSQFVRLNSASRAPN